MKETMKVVMGATLVMVVGLTIVLALVLVLLAELYCSLLLRKHRRRRGGLPTAAAASTNPTSPQPSLDSSTTLSSVYAQGVLLAPRSFLFPPTSNTNTEEHKDGTFHKQQQNQSKFSGHQVLEIQPQVPNTTKTPTLYGLFSASSPSPSYISDSSPQPARENDASEVSRASFGGGGGASGNDAEDLVYISNPIYDNEAFRNGGGMGTTSTTPFETPESSPSHLEMGDGDWSAEEEEASVHHHGASGSSTFSDGPSSSMPMTPPLTPMKKLKPMDSGSVVSLSLRDLRSLSTSGSDSVHNGPSSSSSGSPRTSPSWACLAMALHPRPRFT